MSFKWLLFHFYMTSSMVLLQRPGWLKSPYNRTIMAVGGDSEEPA